MSYRSLFGRLACLWMTVLLLTGGCVVIPLGSGGPLAEAEREEADLIGMDSEELHSRLGEPDYTVELPDITQELYSAPGTFTWGGLAHPILLLGGLPPIFGKTVDVLHCLLVEFRDGKVVDVELDRTGLEYSVEYESCPDEFWTEEEYVVFLKAEAERGDRDAAFLLARQHDDPTYVRALAEQGDRDAAIELAQSFDDFGPLTTIAEQGDGTAAFKLYEQSVLESGPNMKALQWLCVAANAGHAKSQNTMGKLHRSWGVKEEYGFKESTRVAYMWYTLAAENGEISLYSRKAVADEMTAEEVAEATQMARDWKPGQCPGPGSTVTSMIR